MTATVRKAFEQRNGKKITENAKCNRKESQSDEISEKNKGAKGKQECTSDRKDHPDKLGMNNRTELNEGNRNIKREDRRTTAQQGEKRKTTKKNETNVVFVFNQKTRTTHSQQKLKTEIKEKKTKRRKHKHQKSRTVRRKTTLTTEREMRLAGE